MVGQRVEGLPWLLKVCWQIYPINQSAQADWPQQKQAWLPEVSKAGVLVEAVLHGQGGEANELAIISGRLKCVCMLLQSVAGSYAESLSGISAELLHGGCCSS